MACDCGGGIAHPINPTERDQDRGRDRLTVTGLILTPQAQSPQPGPAPPRRIVSFAQETTDP